MIRLGKGVITMTVLVYNFIFFVDLLRYAAYRQLCWWIHTRLGKGLRRIIPACVVKKIREEYPSADGSYTGFQENSEVSETKCSWVAEIE